MKKEISKSKKIFILNKLAELGSITIGSFLPRQYKFTSPSRKLLGFDNNQDNQNIHRSISAILSKLKQEGLVNRAGPKRHSAWSITLKGKNQLENTNKKSGSKKDDGALRLVIFDISEKDRKKRSWLRYQLAILNYKMLQKSVWIGSRALPENFIHELHVLNLQNNVHIFGVNQEGTIPKIK